ncbi:MAG TPA: creatininase family protein [Myxococcales bacterium]|nr:creatininase family protein [Myxococcales bacterium]
MLLKLALWQDVQEYLEKRNDVIIPVGGTEQHGPSGPLGTDLILAEELAADLGEERYAMVAPAIPFGVSQVHGAFPGTIALKPATVLSVVTDAVESLAQQGFRRFLLLNAHHGSKAVLQAACQQVHAHIPDARCLSVQWWELPEVKSVLMEMFGAREGHHATPGELSVVRRFYPRAVLDLPPMERFEPVPQLVAWSAQDFRQRYPSGTVGSDPSLSSGTAGDRIFVAASRGLVEVHRRLVEDP